MLHDSCDENRCDENHDGCDEIRNRDREYDTQLYAYFRCIPKTSILHTLRQKQRQLNQQNQHMVARQCADLNAICWRISGFGSYGSPIARFAHMSRDKLFSKYGLFDPQGDPTFSQEKRQLISLMAHSDTLKELIAVQKLLNIADENLFRKLAAQCTSYASVIEYHLLIWMIVHNATSDSDAPFEKVDGTRTFACCTTSERRIAALALRNRWFVPGTWCLSGYAVRRIIGDVEILLDRYRIPLQDTNVSTDYQTQQPE